MVLRQKGRPTVICASRLANAFWHFLLVQQRFCTATLACHFRRILNFSVNPELLYPLKGNHIPLKLCKIRRRRVRYRVPFGKLPALYGLARAHEYVHLVPCHHVYYFHQRRRLVYEYDFYVDGGIEERDYLQLLVLVVCYYYLRAFPKPQVIAELERNYHPSLGVYLHYVEVPHIPTHSHFNPTENI